jgi:hypothetical protein
MAIKFLRVLGYVGFCALMAGTGCESGPKYELNDKVEGVVTIDGIPLPNVAVQFIPQGEISSKPALQTPLSHGQTDEKGHFDLICNDKPGAVIGKHKVVILPGRGRGDDRDAPGTPEAPARTGKKIPPVPEQYKIAGTTPAAVEVTKDKHSYEVTISSNAGALGK